MQMFKAFHGLMEKGVFVSLTVICIEMVSIVCCFFNLRRLDDSSVPKHADSNENHIKTPCKSFFLQDGNGGGCWT